MNIRSTISTGLVIAASVALAAIAACGRGDTPAAKRDSTASASTPSGAATPSAASPVPATPDGSKEAPRALPAPTHNPIVGRTMMDQSLDLVDNAIASADHTTLVLALKFADLVGTLKKVGPYTLFAPDNAAFDKLPKGRLEALLRPENKAQLVELMSNHVVAGRLDSTELRRRIAAGNGTATIDAAGGAKLTVTMDGDAFAIRNGRGGVVHVTIADAYVANGVMHVVDAVVQPK